MSITVTRRAVPPLSVVALRVTVPTYSDEPELWQRVLPALASQGLEPTGPCGIR